MNSIISTAATAVSLVKGAVDIVKDIKKICNGKSSIDVKLDPDTKKDVYYFDPEKLNRRYNHKSLCISLQIMNTSKEPLSLTDIYITDIDGNNKCYHDPNYNTSFYIYTDVVSEPIPQNLRLEVGGAKSASVRIPNIDAIAENASGMITVRLHIDTSTGQPYEGEFTARQYNEENTRNGAPIMVAGKNLSQYNHDRTQLR